MKKTAVSTAFSTCDKGHDLTQPDAFLYDSGGRRTCRTCAMNQGRIKKPRNRQTFS